MSKISNYLERTLAKGESVYIYYWEENLAVRFQDVENKRRCFFKKDKNGTEVETDWETNTYVQDAFLLGDWMTKEEYDAFDPNVLGDYHFDTLKRKLQKEDEMWRNKQAEKNKLKDKML